jgi:hypothetical protein
LYRLRPFSGKEAIRAYTSTDEKDGFLSKISAPLRDRITAFDDLGTGKKCVPMNVKTKMKNELNTIRAETREGGP